jgi:hypothetical protein
MDVPMQISSSRAYFAIAKLTKFLDIIIALPYKVGAKNEEAELLEYWEEYRRFVQRMVTSARENRMFQPFIISDSTEPCLDQMTGPSRLRQQQVETKEKTTSRT